MFPWLAETIKEERVKTLLVLGDLTDKKDYHPSELVNRVVRSIATLQRDCPGIRIVILTGNHDWLKGGEEYFRFLNQLPNVRFVTEPGEDEDPVGETAMYLPFTKNPLRDWKGLDLQHYRYVFMHQTVSGAVSSNGMTMEGEELPSLRDAGKVYSGDIHVPQEIGTPWGRVEYVGSPYHVHFGDNFKPRAVLLEKGGRAIDLHFKSPKRVAIKATSMRHLMSYDLGAGDQVKLTYSLSAADKHAWSAVRREAVGWLKSRGVEIHGVDLQVERSDTRVDNERARVARNPGDAVLTFVEIEELTPIAYEIAMEVVDK